MESLVRQVAVSHLLQLHANRRQKIEHIARLHEVEQDRLSIELLCDLENRVPEPSIAVVRGIFLQPLAVANLKTVTVSNTVAEMVNEFQFRCVIEVIIAFQPVTEREQRTGEPGAGKFFSDCFVRQIT